MDATLTIIFILLSIAATLLASYYFIIKGLKDNNAVLLLSQKNNDQENNELKKQLSLINHELQQSKEQFEIRLGEKEKAFEQQQSSITQSKDEQIAELKDQNKESLKNLQTHFDQQSSEQKLSFEKRLEDQKEQFDRLQKDLKYNFQHLANDILEEKSKKMDEHSERNLNELLNPLKEKINLFETRIKESYDKEARERFSMQKELQSLVEMNHKLSSDAQSLTQALKGDSKMQGDWGEMILERILEQSGLQEGREYFKQMNVKDEQNKNLRPDFVVQYPGERYLVIDSKVSLRAYENYRQADDIKEQEQFIKKHIDDIKIHIQQLSDKKYDDYVPGSSLDFVLMFMPIEGALMSAMQHDKSLWNHAFDKRILLISPTNLVAALRMITTLWKHDAQNKNVLSIAEESGKLYDKFVGFVEDLDKIDIQLAKTRDSFEDAKKKLSSGKGNLVSKAENLKALGAKTKKNLHQAYLNLSQHNSHEE